MLSTGLQIISDEKERKTQICGPNPSVYSAVLQVPQLYGAAPSFAI